MVLGALIKSKRLERLVQTLNGKDRDEFDNKRSEVCKR